MTITKKHIAVAIAEAMGFSQAQAKELVQRVLDAIAEALMHQGRLELRNFGIFEVRERKPRRARNPRTGERVEVPARRIITFKPGREMAERLGRLRHLPSARA